MQTGEKRTGQSAPGHLHRMLLAAAVVSGLPLLAAMSAQAQDAPKDLTGSWQVSLSGKNGQVRQFTLQLQEQGPALSGTMNGQRGSRQVTGQVKGSEVSLNVQGGRPMMLTGTANGNTISGSTGDGASWSASRGGS